jgi:succinate-acetate transporter protein
VEGSLREGSGPVNVVREAGWSPANPAPLGLAGFAMTTFVLSVIKANWVSSADVPVVLGLALAYGGVAQLLAGMWEFRAGNTFGAVAFSSFGAFWISFFVLVMFNAGQIVPPGNAAHAIGLYEWAWAIFTFYMTIAALRTNGAVLLVFILLTVTFALYAIGDSGGNLTVTHWGGYIGVATAVAAWYASFAQVINSTFGKTVAPLFPLGR